MLGANKKKGGFFEGLLIIKPNIMKKLLIISMVFIAGISMSFTSIHHNKSDKEGYIGIYLKWSSGTPAKHVKVTLGECGGTLGESGYTDNDGFVKLYNHDMFYACAIYVKGKKV